MSTGGDASGAGPNWYADPQTPGRLRYWDGMRWTIHTAPVASSAPTSPDGSPPVQWSDHQGRKDREALAASVSWYRDLARGAGAARPLPSGVRAVLQFATVGPAADAALAERTATAIARDAEARETRAAQLERRGVVVRASWRALRQFLLGFVGGVVYGALPVLVVYLVVYIYATGGTSGFSGFIAGYIIALATVGIVVGIWFAVPEYRERTR